MGVLLAGAWPRAAEALEQLATMIAADHTLTMLQAAGRPQQRGTERARDVSKGQARIVVNDAASTRA